MIKDDCNYSCAGEQNLYTAIINFSADIAYDDAIAGCSSHREALIRLLYNPYLLRLIGVGIGIYGLCNDPGCARIGTEAIVRYEVLNDPDPDEEPCIYELDHYHPCEQEEGQ